MMSEPIFLDIDDVLKLHDLQIIEFGGSHGMRDQGLLESAVGMPQASFGGEFVHDSIFLKAAAYAFHIAENQPCVDGNKRTALVSALVFLELNGHTVLDPRESLYTAMISIAKKTLNKEGLASLLESLVASSTGNFCTRI